VVVLIAVTGVRFWTKPVSSAVPAMAGGSDDWQKFVNVGGSEIFGLWEMDVGMGRSLLHQGIPLLKKRNNPQKLYGTPRGFLRAFLDLVGDVEIANPLSILRRSILPLARISLPDPEQDRLGRTRPSIPPDRRMTQALDWGELPLVAIYHTHGTETYLPEAGVERTKGTPGGVVEVGAILAETLWQDYRIPVVHNQTIHDYPKWRLSYVNAEETAAELVKTYSKLRIVIDLHRDAIKNAEKSDYVIDMDGQETARVMMVVGTDKLGLPHPNWRENYRFAREIDALLKTFYPGLSRGVDLRDDGRWNQHLHPQSIIFEVGEVHQTKASAKAAARCLARVLYEYLLREKQKEMKD
jgi:stage II sporulation protein P